MNIGVVMPCGAGRDHNVQASLQALANLDTKPSCVVLVLDGPDALLAPDGNQPQITGLPFPHALHRIHEKHEPGMEQPRNIGVRVLRQHYPDVTHAWFVDSDIIVEPDCLDEIESAYEAIPELPSRIMVCPYDWMTGNVRPENTPNFFDVAAGVRNDPRWPSFEQYIPSDVLEGDLAAGLACFSGNLVWPISEFTRVGGFWSEINHGRCEDGELGLRAVAMDVGISFASLARGYHLEHPVNMQLAMERNARDVPMLNNRHPWVEQGGVFMVDRDGKAFDVTCFTCGETVPTIKWWEHADECNDDVALPVAHPCAVCGSERACGEPPGEDCHS